ncbi:putative ORFan [Tupanvirus deep ocean]|uniref:ORFan n=2 Tax=Tupanvirus TaxID=2094720 RepID=A0AC62A974_9VIRU|nr:putative ORFan [Tupanvirus deep ocean]QKU34341.1 putative ORFan [Tupanvirus deep ocean]
MLLASAIHDGGMLLANETYVNGLFKPTNDNLKWTHLF